jgi:hypothetical protein
MGTAKVKTEKKLGRPTKFTDEMAEKAYELAAAGESDDKIAEYLNISRSTLTLWKAKDLNFSVAMRKSKAMADELVEISLYQLATGFEITKDIVVRDEVKTLKLKTQPDIRAIQFWLKNRNPEKWRDKQEVEHTNPDGNFKPLVNIYLPKKDE